ncbi:SDR family NAD(P)-dependent oxidoreductase [Corynebacterium lizhenjunii]|uniref:SDR family NAD(P)-dependent oxidoreductase n=1 Tax=Corynebacterium lizhenjunii TaxID=2709394 RepID=A0A7T0KGA4_9CORY|nr:SDR family NAD(P)-dependent oxidoreductase [Corynebacterium lizhenjunii]QPK80181.1 SDR family NAD(P)-dependent oxidoreductase [Corynebacterium lizhenjunii]
MSGLVIFGGRSEIGTELGTLLCAGRPVVLAVRPGTTPDVARFERAGASAVHVIDFDALESQTHAAAVAQAQELAGPLHTAIVAFGILGDQERAQTNPEHAREIATVDYTAQVSVLTLLTNTMDRGHIVAFSSIAGWRARRANYVYGSTKAGLDAFCQGLADRLHGGPLALITARPGFVIGSMTAGMSPAPLSVDAPTVAAAVAREIRSGSGRSTTLWIPGRLRLLAWVMRCVPRPLWRRMPR